MGDEKKVWGMKWLFSKSIIVLSNQDEILHVYPIEKKEKDTVWLKFPLVQWVLKMSGLLLIPEVTNACKMEETSSLNNRHLG